MSEEQKKTIRVRIQNDGQLGYMTKITDAETGKSLDHWQVYRVELDARDRELPIAMISVYMPVVDIIADAEINHVCPCCGRAVEEEPG